MISKEISLEVQKVYKMSKKNAVSKGNHIPKNRRRRFSFLLSFIGSSKFLYCRKNLLETDITSHQENFISEERFIHPGKPYNVHFFFKSKLSCLSNFKKSLNKMHSINFWTAAILEAEETTFAKIHFPSWPKNREQDQQVQTQKTLIALMLSEC